MEVYQSNQEQSIKLPTMPKRINTGTIGVKITENHPEEFIN